MQLVHPRYQTPGTGKAAKHLFMPFLTPHSLATKVNLPFLFTFPLICDHVLVTMTASDGPLILFSFSICPHSFNNIK